MNISRSVITAVLLLAGALLATPPAIAQVLQGEPGAPTTREFPDSRGQILQSFQAFPPRQKPGSFSVDQAMEELMRQKSSN